MTTQPSPLRPRYLNLVILVLLPLLGGLVMIAAVYATHFNWGVAAAMGPVAAGLAGTYFATTRGLPFENAAARGAFACILALWPLVVFFFLFAATCATGGCE